MGARIAGTLLVLGLAAGLGLVAWPQALGLERMPVVAQVVALRGAGIVAAVAAAIVLLTLGLLVDRVRRLLAVLTFTLLAFALGVTGIMLARGIGAPDLPSAGANDLTVLSWNTLGDSVPPKDVARVALAADADVVTLPETSEQAADAVAARMKEEGRPMRVLVVAFDQVATSRSTALLVSRSLGRYALDRGVGSTRVLPSVVARPAGGQNGPVIVAVHSVAPAPDQLTSWRRDLRWIAGRCATRNVLLSGDFNATLDHFAGFGSGPRTQLGGCRDAGLASGNGAVGTWPTNVPALVGAPIDHVLATPNWRISGFRVLAGEDSAGSDHRPVLARLSPAG